ncbi:rho GTPase-activating protein 26-like isoform X2 [Varroa jacobsoni]|uniref:Rho GTPase-activating protein 26 n=1 Tax=Varroa destructor TaxID=109461 RepID=A0A7M7JUG0_VARDE|nr:rho GTPase-activating protein 26-like isoform X7 [Varroa destructor]XP_022706550.1 rho GTPase-activating protein 26-like isoform X2 [Varroa jacobsoni]
MGLLPLEFRDCLTDSPQFRDNLASHEKELEITSQSIKGIIKEIKELLNAAKNLSRAQRNLAKTFSEFRFETIGTSQTDDEIVIGNSLKEFSRLLNAIEDERDRMLLNAFTLIEPIDRFRKERIGEAKEKRKRFEKETAKYCSVLEKSLAQSVKKSEPRETDQEVGSAQLSLFKISLEYVLHLQRVQEGKKTEFVETILRFMYGWLTFYHQGHEVSNEFTSFNLDLQRKLQKTRESLEITNSQAENLMKKMLSERQDPGSLNRMYTREGYLYLLEKKHLGTVWTKHFCQYRKEDRKFTMIPYSQHGNQKITNCETLHLAECVRRMSETIDRRYCFDVTPRDRGSGNNTVYTFQALNAEDHRLWLAAMDGKEPRAPTIAGGAGQGGNTAQTNVFLTEDGIRFVRLCIEAIEKRGIDDQGIYRTAGVTSKVTKLTNLAVEQFADKKKGNQLNLMDANEWEVKTIASSLKTYLRLLKEPLLTFSLYQEFIKAAKFENAQERVNEVEKLVQKLPAINYRMLKMLIEHLVKVSDNKATNLMSISNLGVCFGPTLLRAEEETVAAIMDIKFCNIIIEILIEHSSVIFAREVPSTAAAGGHVGGGASTGAMNSYEGVRQDPSRPAPIGSVMASGVHPSPQQQMQLGVGSPLRCPLRSDQLQQQMQQMSASPMQYHAAGYSPAGANSPNPTTAGSAQHLPQKTPHHVQESGMYGYARDVYTAVPVANGVPQTGSVPQAPLRHQYVGHTHSYPVASQWNNRTDSPSGSSNPQGYASPQSTGGVGSNVPNYNTSSSQPVLSSHGSLSSASGGGSSSGVSGSLKGPVPLGPPVIQGVQTGLGCRVRTLYACVGENEQELSFEPNQIITDVRPSHESGWLEGVLQGKRGLIPENYIQYLRD